MSASIAGAPADGASAHGRADAARARPGSAGSHVWVRVARGAAGSVYPAWVRDPDDSLVSERLAVRRFTIADADLFTRLYGDPEVMRYCGGTLAPEAATTVLRERILEYYPRFPGLGMWATIERASGECIGMHLLAHVRGESDIQVGYLLFPRFWGRGYATEMAGRLLDYGFRDLAIPQIVAITDQPHVASQQVLLKIGLRRKGERLLPQYHAEPMAWFERDAGDWLAEHPAPATPTGP